METLGVMSAFTTLIWGMVSPVETSVRGARLSPLHACSARAPATRQQSGFTQKGKKQRVQARPGPRALRSERSERLLPVL